MIDLTIEGEAAMYDRDAIKKEALRIEVEELVSTHGILEVIQAIRHMCIKQAGEFWLREESKRSLPWYRLGNGLLSLVRETPVVMTDKEIAEDLAQKAKEYITAATKCL